MVRSMKRNLITVTTVTLAALGLMVSACRDHDTGHSGHDSSQSRSGQTHQAQTGAALSPTEGASVKTLAPTKDQVFTSDQVPLRFELVKGKAGHHTHAYVDGELMGMFKSEKGTLTGLKPGKHTLELRVVASDHKTELDAADKVEFSVQK